VQAPATDGTLRSGGHDSGGAYSGAGAPARGPRSLLRRRLLEDAEITVEEQLERLERRVEEFVACIRGLPDRQFLAKMNGWSPRDVVAHLIGWSTYTIEGCEEMRRGERPSYLSDWRVDFQNINAVSVQRFCSEDKQELLDELAASLEVLKQYLRSIPREEWASNPGVNYLGYRITVQNSIEGLTGDYAHHTRQVEEWVASLK
jgi:hypothetical protein